jgi:integrase/recombinase XerD
MTTATPGSPLRQRMVEDMVARKLGPGTQRGHILACKQFAAYLGRSPKTATPDDIRSFQRHLIDSGRSAHYRNRIMTGVKFLLKVTMRRHDLVAEIYHLREPQTVAVVLAPAEVVQVLSSAPSLKARVMLTIGYGCGLRAGEVTRLRVSDIDSAQRIIRVMQSKGPRPATTAGSRRASDGSSPAIMARSRSHHASFVVCSSKRRLLPASKSR